MNKNNFSYGKIDLDIVGAYDVPQFFIDYLSLNRNKDIMPVMFKLAHANTNANKDTFLEEEMIKSIKTPVNKPLDWEHDREDAIGFIAKSFFIKLRDGEILDVLSSDDSDERINECLGDELNARASSGFAKAFTEYTQANDINTNELLNISEGENSFILAIGIIWSQIHKDRAELMINRSKSGNLKWSMEAFFEDEECSHCGNTSIGKTREEYIQCECLRQRYSIKGYSRILRNINFAGAGVVTDPADSLAFNVALGKKNKLNVEVADMDSNFPMSFETSEQLEAYILERNAEVASEEELNSLKSAVASLGEANTSIEKELEETKVLLVEKEEEFATKLQECEATIESLNSVVAAYKAKEKEELGVARLQELKKAGMSIASEKEESFSVELSEKTEEDFNKLLDIISSTFVAARNIIIDAAEPTSDEATVPIDLAGNDNSEELVTASVTDNSEDKLDLFFAKSSKIKL